MYYEPKEEVEEVLRQYPGSKMLYDVRMSDRSTRKVSEFGKGSPAKSWWSSKGTAGEAFGLWLSLYIRCHLLSFPLSLSPPDLSVESLTQE